MHWLVAAATTLLSAAPAALALQADEIALIVNASEPKGLELARLYAQVRGIAPDRIIQLELPNAEVIFFDLYDRQVVPQVRQFLRQRGLEHQVKCLVSFYGVPLRIAHRINTPEEKIEQELLGVQFRRVLERIEQIVSRLEKQAAELGGDFVPQSGGRTLGELSARTEHAWRSLTSAMQRTSDPAAGQRIGQVLGEMAAILSGPVDLPEPTTTSTMPAATQTARLNGENGPTTRGPATESIQELLEQPYNAASRRRLRELTRRSGGIFAYARVLQSQIEYLTTEQTAAAFDSELSLIWWPAYPRTGWQPNPLNPHYGQTRLPPVVMVMRLDGPEPQIVRNIIESSVQVERRGLEGKLVVDARGIAPRDTSGKEDAYGQFDRRLRNLATLVLARTNMQVKLDDLPAVLPAGSVDDVALYCGWYSLRSYVPGMKFNRGAVGYHIASLELLSLRDPQETGWVRGLLRDGVAGTLGPVAEPYLHAFPPPEEFFPLLLSGKFTLAEVYWTTVPMTSWMMCCIGDPLYNPYLNKPQMKVDDLPLVFRNLFR